MKSAVLALLLLLFSTIAAAQRTSNPVLILVQPGLPNLFDPQIDPSVVVHDVWIRWPAEQIPATGNRLMSISTGLNWQGDAADFQFLPAGPQAWKSSAYARLLKSGYFKARNLTWKPGDLVALTNEPGGTPRDVLLLALGPTSPLVRTTSFTEAWPAEKTMVIEARTASDLKRVTSRTKGRILVVEYPPPPGQNWSRAWLRGATWPDGIPFDPSLKIPGLVSAGSIGKLLQAPAKLDWAQAPTAWSGANRWMAVVQSMRLPLLAAAGITFLGVAFLSAYFVAQEQRNAWLATALRVFSLVPAAIVLGGNISLYAGLSGIFVWMFVAIAALSGIAAAINLGVSKAGWRPDMLGYGAVGLTALLLCDPRFSVFSLVFGSGTTGSPGEPLGAMLASGSIVLGCFRPWRRSNRLVVLACTGILIAIAIVSPVWWAEGGLSLGAWLWVVPAACWAKDRGLLFVAGLGTGALLAGVIFLHGFAYLPFGLIRTVDQVRSINTFELVHVLISPTMIGTVFFLAVTALFGTPFLGHQVRMSWRTQGGPPVLVGCMAWCVALALVEPRLLEAGLYLACGLLIVVFEALLRPADPIADE